MKNLLAKTLFTVMIAGLIRNKKNTLNHLRITQRLILYLSKFSFFYFIVTIVAPKPYS